MFLVLIKQVNLGGKQICEQICSLYEIIISFYSLKSERQSYDLIKTKSESNFYLIVRTLANRKL